MTNEKLIYKIVHRDLWESAKSQGVFNGAEIDLSDGFIHFSAEHQVQETANRHFAGQTGLLIVAVEAAPLGEALRWEKSRDGELFPHLYASLDPTNVKFVRELLVDKSGSFQFPDLSGE